MKNYRQNSIKKNSPQQFIQQLETKFKITAEKVTK